MNGNLQDRFYELVTFSEIKLDDNEDVEDAQETARSMRLAGYTEESIQEFLDEREKEALEQEKMMEELKREEMGYLKSCESALGTEQTKSPPLTVR